MCEITENTLRRFYASEIRCVFCGAMISKKETPYYEKNNKFDMIRKWNCPMCPAHYQENVSELKRMGVL